jgi:hypothetical protein
VLYSLHFGTTLDSEDQLALFLSDTMSREFDTLALLIQERVIVEEINAIYTIIERHKAIDRVVVLTLHKNEDLPRDMYTRYERSFILNLPKTLRVRENLFDMQRAHRQNPALRRG